jgi:pimeloyl-ACP methyl ester carboxylesterase
MQGAVDRYAEVNGLRIHYLDWGTSGKQPLVLLHGIYPEMISARAGASGVKSDTPR